MKCVAYCRVSTDEKDQLNSFENQKQHYLEMFKKTKGIEPAKCGMLYRKKGQSEKRIVNEDGIFADEGISGTKLKNREAFKYMMECAKKRQFDAIYVKNVSRFSRYIVDGVTAFKNLKGYGIKVIFETEGLDSSTDNFEMMFNYAVGHAQEESRAKSKAVKFGLNALHQKGGYSGSAVFGYNRVKGFLEINPEEAEIVKTIFRMYFDEVRGVNNIARYLNEKNILTKKKAKWTLIKIRYILRNELYTGVVTTNKTTKTDINVESNKELGTNYIEKIDPSEWIRTERPELKIIEKDYFAKVQAEIERRKEEHKKNFAYRGTNLLSNLIICGHCGSSYRRKQRGRGKNKDKLGYYLTCGRRDSYGASMCGYRYTFMEDYFIELIKNKLLELKQANLDSEFEAYLGIYYNFDPARMEELNREIEKINNRIDVNFNAHADGIISKEDFLRRNNTFQEKKKELSAEYDRMKNHEYEIKQAKQKYKEYKKCLAEIDLNNLTNVDLRKIFRRIIIKPYGRSLYNKQDTALLMAEFDFYFLDININKLFEDIQGSEFENKRELLNKLQYNNFEGMVMRRGKNKFFELEKQEG